MTPEESNMNPEESYMPSEESYITPEDSYIIPEESYMISEESHMTQEEDQYRDTKPAVTDEERPTSFNRHMDDGLAHNKTPININVSYGSAINDSTIEKDDTALAIGGNTSGNSRPNGSSVPSTTTHSMDSGLESNYNLHNSKLYPKYGILPESSDSSPPLYIPPDQSSYDPSQNVPNAPPGGLPPPVPGYYQKVNTQSKHHKHEPCPLMVSRPWSSEPLSGDFKPS